MNQITNKPLNKTLKVQSDTFFYIAIFSLSGIYVLSLVTMLIVDFSDLKFDNFLHFFQNKTIMASLKLSLISCSITTVLCLWVAVPMGYIFSRFQFRGKALIDAILDIPIMLPPLVLGIILLIFFNSSVIKYLENVFEMRISPANTQAGVILAQFMVACAFSIRAMRNTFDEIPTRQEDVAMTLGSSRSQAFWGIILPKAKRGMVTAATLAWARSLGEFGPILIFAGATRNKTEVLSTSVYLEFSVGDIEMAMTVSFIMIIVAVFVMMVMRLFGSESLRGRKLT